ncbi:MAG: hypothetical protein IJ493_04830 [Clostridia bacterium]|nr:hypothetical protein [Clostridia bacterium]
MKKYWLHALFPILALILVMVLTVSLLAVGYSDYAFTVAFDDCGGLLDGLAVSGRFYQSGSYGCSFKLNAGETVKAETHVQWKELKSYYGMNSAIWSSSTVRDILNRSLIAVVTVPDDATLTPIDNVYPDLPYCYGSVDRDGETVLDGFRAKGYTADKLTYQYALSRGSLENLIEYTPEQLDLILLGEPRTVTAEEYGKLTVWMAPYFDYSKTVPKSGYPYVSYNTEWTAWFSIGDISELPHGAVFAEKTKGGYAVTHVDALTTDNIGSASVWVTTLDADRKVISTERIAAFEDNEKLSLAGIYTNGENAAVCAVRDGDMLELRALSCGKSPVRVLTLYGVEDASVASLVSNGAVCMRISTNYDTVTYAAVDPASGKLLAYGSTPFAFDSRLLNYNSSVPGFDALWDGERLYVLDRSDYECQLYSTNTDNQERLALYGGGVIGHAVSISVMDKDGEIAMGLHPITANFSGSSGSGQYVQLYFEVENES